MENDAWVPLSLEGDRRRLLVGALFELDGAAAVGTRGGGLFIQGSDGHVTRLIGPDGPTANDIECAVVMEDGSALVVHGMRGRGPSPPHPSFRDQDGAWSVWDPGPLSGMDVVSVASDARGHLWFGTANKGLWRFDSLVRSADGSEEPWAAYTTEDGLPSNTIDVLATAPDGTVWVGTPMGVAKKASGEVEFERFSEKDALPSNGVMAILIASDGTTWVGTRGGAARYTPTGWVVHRSPFDTQRFPVRLEQSADGALWASTTDGLYRFIRDGWERELPFESPQPVFDLVSGYDGSLWALGGRSLLVREDETWRSVSRGVAGVRRGGLRFIAARRAGGCWLSGRGGLYAHDGQALRQIEIERRGLIRVLYESTDGTLWLGAGQDLYRYRDGRLDRVDEVMSLDLGGPEALIERPNGEIWVSFLAGVWRLSDRRWSMLPEGGATGYDGVRSMFVASDQTVWLSSILEGAIHTDGRTTMRYGARSGLPSTLVWDIAEDSRGNLWFSTDQGLGCYRPDGDPPDTFVIDPHTRVAPFEPVYMRFAGHDSWMGTPDDALLFSWRMDGGSWTPFTADRQVLFDRLKPGMHTFEARSIDRQFNIDPSAARVSFDVLAPVWLRPWFLALSLFGLIAIGVSTVVAVKRHRDWKSTQIQLVEELESELQEAHEMQMGLLPREPVVTDQVEASGRCLPANHVGGDFYSFDWIDGDRRRFVCSAADVSGKAMKAAVRVMQLSGMYRYELRPERSPGQVLRGLHGSLLDHLDDTSFVTGCLMSLDVESGEVLLANAGHPYPLIRRAGSGEIEEIPMPSIPLGMTLPFGSTHNVAETSVSLDPGDTVLLYSDGVTDLANEAEDFYGEERLIEMFRKTGDVGADGSLDALMTDLDAFKGNAAQLDDVTAVAICWKPSP